MASGDNVDDSGMKYRLLGDLPDIGGDWKASLSNAEQRFADRDVQLALTLEVHNPLRHDKPVAFGRQADSKSVNESTSALIPKVFWSKLDFN